MFETKIDGCRFCLKNNVPLHSLFKKVPECGNRQLSEIAMSFAAVFISKEDGLPEKICDECFRALVKCHNLRSQMEEADATLRHRLESDELKKQLLKPKKKCPSLNAEELKENKEITKTEKKTEKKCRKTRPKRCKTTRKVCCEKCGKIFSTFICLTAHYEVHLREEGKSPTHMCEICGKTFYSEHYLKQRHMLRRHREKVTCDTCGKDYSTKKALLVHLICHTTEQPFVCKFCNRAFNRKWNFRQHERLHTGIMPYVCNVCGERFRHNVTMKQHRARHEKETP